MDELVFILLALVLAGVLFFAKNDYDHVCVNGESYISLNDKHFYKLEDKDIFCKQEEEGNK